ncbi:PorV/PorQ family protein, partial [candidate division KSB1 bacterium]
MKRKLTLILLLAIAICSFANKPYRVGTTAANFLEMGVGGAANGMGEAYVAAARDLSSVYWNAAGLSYMTANEVQFSYQPWIADINVAFVGGGVILPRIGTLALSVLSMNYGRTGVTTLEMQEGTGETYQATEYAATFTYARKLAQWFAFGASGKYVISNIWHMGAQAAAVDLGVLINTHFLSPTGERQDGMTIGMSISNYGTRMQYDGMDLLRPIDILPNQNGNYKDVEGQFRLQQWELPLILRLGVA